MALSYVAQLARQVWNAVPSCRFAGQALIDRLPDVDPVDVPEVVP
jgi:hypothetical protein